jgi:hypothetical protein
LYTAPPAALATGVQPAHVLVTESKLWKPEAQTATEHPLAVLLAHSRQALTDSLRSNP